MTSPIQANRIGSLDSYPGADFQPPGDADDDILLARSAELSEALAAADPVEAVALRKELVVMHLASADSVARRYRGRGLDEQDLVQVARLGLVEAAARYDPSLGSFLAFAIPTMTGMIRRHFRDRGWAVKPPRSIQEQFPRLSQARHELAHELLRWPTTPEVAARLSLSAEQVRLTREADGCFQTSSLDVFVGARPEPLGERLPEPEDGYAQLEQQLILEPAWRQLSDRDRRVVYLRFYDELSQREIAEEFGVSQMQISRWLTRILIRLRDIVDGTGAHAAS
jgi:RNA polymerase sigma-B factor